MTHPKHRLVNIFPLFLIHGLQFFAYFGLEARLLQLTLLLIIEREYDRLGNILAQVREANLVFTGVRLDVEVADSFLHLGAEHLFRLVLHEEVNDGHVALLLSHDIEEALQLFIVAEDLEEQRLLILRLDVEAQHMLRLEVAIGQEVGNLFTQLREVLLHLVERYTTLLGVFALKSRFRLGLVLLHLLKLAQLLFLVRMILPLAAPSLS